MKQLGLVIILLGLFAATPVPRAPSAPGRPSLVVVIVVDQMRADYLQRYAGLFNHGFTRLTTRGAWFQRAMYPYMNTFTCVGHTTIGTGTLPYKHGIVDNTWYDRQQQKKVTCTEDAATTEVGYGPYTGIGDSAHNMRMPSLAEIMRRDDHARVATLSLKARAAIGLAGHSADSVVWFDDRGGWETSSAFAAAPLPWMSTFAAAHPIDADANKVWDRLLPADRYQGPDDAPGERGPAGWSRTFPHPLGASGARGFYLHWESSPYSDAYLEQMTEDTIDSLQLGQRQTGGTDFLGVSFSALDYVGHAYGPRSQEVQDLLAHLDVSIGRLLDHLDEKVGAGHYVLALTADHGVADVAEQTEGGGRVAPTSITQAINAALEPVLGQGPFVATTIESDVYFKPGIYERVEGHPAAYAAAVKAVSGLPGVARVFRGTDLASAAARASHDNVIRAAALSYVPGRSGDLIVVPRQGWEMTTSAASHGSPYAYDQRVPVVFYGAGVRAGVRRQPVSPLDIAATLAAIVGVHLPSPDGHSLTPLLGRSR